MTAIKYTSVSANVLPNEQEKPFQRIIQWYAILMLSSRSQTFQGFDQLVGLGDKVDWFCANHRYFDASLILHFLLQRRFGVGW